MTSSPVTGHATRPGRGGCGKVLSAAVPDVDPADALTDPQRLAALRRLALLDTPPEPAFDRLTRLATKVVGAPVALVSLVEVDRQFFKSQVGLGEPWASRRESPMSHSFCRFAVASGTPFVVEDARRHPQVRENPGIVEMGIVAYAGIPLFTAEGFALGTLCAIDSAPRQWTVEQIGLLGDLALAATTEIELRRVVREHRALLEGAGDVSPAAEHSAPA